MAPSYEQCITSLARVEAAQRGPGGKGIVTDPYVLCAGWIAEARTYLGRACAYRETGSAGGDYADDEAVRCLVRALRALGAERVDALLALPADQLNAARVTRAQQEG